ncbi:hypothetical protein HDU76_006882, partial [Blyttiomyces sp. JEL0837]
FVGSIEKNCPTERCSHLITGTTHNFQVRFGIPTLPTVTSDPTCTDAFTNSPANTPTGILNTEIKRTCINGSNATIISDRICSNDNCLINVAATTTTSTNSYNLVIENEYQNGCNTTIGNNALGSGFQIDCNYGVINKPSAKGLLSRNCFSGGNGGVCLFDLASTTTNGYPLRIGFSN